MMNLDTHDIRSIIANGTKYYSIEDFFKRFLPDKKWDGKDAQIYIETNSTRDGYSDESHIVEMIKKNNPPELGGFDKLLKAIVKVPKIN